MTYLPVPSIAETENLSHVEKNVKKTYLTK
jgi:hypothetical protein